MEEPGRLQSMGSRRVGHDWAISLSLFTFMHWRRKWQPLQCSCLENPRDRGAWWAAVYGVAQSRTWLKRLSSSRKLWKWKWMDRKSREIQIYLLQSSHKWLSWLFLKEEKGIIWTKWIWVSLTGFQHVFWSCWGYTTKCICFVFFFGKLPEDVFPPNIGECFNLKLKV